MAWLPLQKRVIFANFLNSISEVWINRSELLSLIQMRFYYDSLSHKLLLHFAFYFYEWNFDWKIMFLLKQDWWKKSQKVFFFFYIFTWGAGWHGMTLDLPSPPAEFFITKKCLFNIYFFMPSYPPSQLLIASIIVWGGYRPHWVVQCLLFLYLMLQTVTGVLSYRRVGVFCE